MIYVNEGVYEIVFQQHRLLLICSVPHFVVTVVVAVVVTVVVTVVAAADLVVAVRGFSCLNELAFSKQFLSSKYKRDQHKGMKLMILFDIVSSVLYQT